jgi:pSer/pThr/pTyr-binding forkhead associated (FHA) protein
MLLLAWSDGRGSSGTEIASTFPFTIGRAPGANLRLESSGVWDNHARILLDSAKGRFSIQRCGESIVLLNGGPAQESELTPGDRLQLGSAEILILLAPASSKPLRAREGAAWAFIALIAILEGVLAFLFI